VVKQHPEVSDAPLPGRHGRNDDGIGFIEMTTGFAGDSGVML
jgi:hypothetical protein